LLKWGGEKGGFAPVLAPAFSTLSRLKNGLGRLAAGYKWGKTPHKTPQNINNNINFQYIKIFSHTPSFFVTLTEYS
jgi:hypothetical protein